LSKPLETKKVPDFLGLMSSFSSFSGCGLVGGWAGVGSGGMNLLEEGGEIGGFGQSVNT
jgi:hypothetical protein